tara:strand:- start:2 stop:727 length:726 start_codon:yes stop_codon:yes gene_type:complete
MNEDIDKEINENLSEPSQDNKKNANDNNLTENQDNSSNIKKNEEVRDNTHSSTSKKVINDESIKTQNEENLSEIKNENDNTEKELNIIENLKNEKLRLLADMDNLRKRFEKDKAESIKYGSISLAREMLSPSDNLSRALESIPSDQKFQEPIKQLIDGLQMVQKEFITIFEKIGVKKIESLHKKFDHNYHQAMLEIETDEFEEGIVVKEIQTGFIMHDRLLRPSMVGVSKMPKKSKKSEKK